MALPRRAVIVIPVLSPYDAISEAAVDTARLIASLPGWQVAVLTTHSKRTDMCTKLVSGVADLLIDPDFLAADLIFYHFGLYHPVFDALLLGNARARQVVRFHNVTPPSQVRMEDVPLIQASLRQIANFARADIIWADSDTNARELRANGITEADIETIPLVVGVPARSQLSDKPGGVIELLFLGRFVRSKGVLDLIKALTNLRAHKLPPIRLRLAGNQTFSDPAYVEEVKREATEMPGEVLFLGTVDDATRDELLRTAHILAIPSYHEGFCKPVVEGLRTGCIPLGYACHNLPEICHGLGRLVPPGDIQALAGAIAELTFDIATTMQSGCGTALRLDRGTTRGDEFERIVDDYVSGFEFPAVRERSIRSLRRLMPEAV